MAASLRFVTGYVRLDAHRPHEDYVELGNRLLSLPVPITLRCDHPELFDCGETVEARPAGGLWLLDVVSDGVAIPTTNNPAKDTLAYHAVQHQKTAWLSATAGDHPDDLLVWIDLGILHVPGVTEDSVVDLARRASQMRDDTITLASIWGPPEQFAAIAPQRLHWHCAGGIVVCPARLAAEWHADCVETASALYREARRATYEVNTWASVWQRKPHGFAWYSCDHDSTLLSNCPC